jgi:undecaprenyl-diphosphatase
MSSITAWDLAILQFIQQGRNAFLDTVLPMVTHLADKGMIWIVLGMVLLCFRKTRTCGICVLICLLVDCILGERILKHIFCRQRPCVIQPISDMLIAAPHSYSFPSGHTASSFTAATAIFLCHKRAGAVALCAAAIIGFSRLYLYVHFPTDVLCGALLGIGVAALLTPRLRRHFG